MKQKKTKSMIVLGLLLLGITVGYAILSTNLNINGTSIINKPTWDIHFENIVTKSGSITPGTAAHIVNNTSVEYAVTFDTPGQFYEFNVDVKNAGTIDGMIESVTSTVNNQSISNLPSYVEYYVTYSDGSIIAPNHLLAAGDKETYTVHIGFSRDINPEDLPSSAETYNLNFEFTDTQANNDATPVPHSISFTDDSWDVITQNVRNGNTNNYNVGDTKTIDMGSFGTHTLRIANKSTPTECSTSGFSQTACGFVLEFADIITTHAMNTTDINEGGWPASSMRTYVNSDIYNALPSDLKNSIINTTVVSGHGSGEATNFTSTDKIYLFSSHEIWEDDDGNTSAGIDYYDTAYNKTRQLDYYAGLNVTITNYSNAIKQRNGSNDWWWLRSIESRYAYTFNDVSRRGGWSGDTATESFGVSPAFRIG